MNGACGKPMENSVGRPKRKTPKRRKDFKMPEKSHVGMLNCWICGQGAEIILDRRLSKSLDMDMGSLPDIICSECKTMSEENNAIWLISLMNGEVPPENKEKTWNPYRTGGCVLTSKEAVIKSLRSILVEEAIEPTVALIEKNYYFYLPDQIWDLIGLPERGQAINNLPKKEDPTDEAGDE
jgi:hypothetical protein